MNFDDEWLQCQLLPTQRKERLHLTDAPIIWLDNASGNAEQERENTLFFNVTRFDNADECFDYITDIGEDSRIYFVLNYSSLSNYDNTEYLLSILQSMRNVYQIYFLSHSDEITWTPKFSKVKSIVSFIEMRHEVRSTEEHLSLAFSVVNGKSIFLSSNVGKSNTQEASFMYTRLFKQIVLSIHSPIDEKREREEMISFWRSYYTQHNNRSALAFLEQYEHDESHHSTIWWYSCDGFLYKMLNEACRTQDIETMYAMRGFIRCLHREIEQLSSAEPSHQSTLVLYRGQQLSLAAFEEIRSRPGGLLSINSFFSTTLNKELALIFAGVSDRANIISIVFQIEISHMASEVVSFANIDSASAFGGAEAEYLFSFGSVFRIGDMDQHSYPGGVVWFIQITLTMDNDPEQLCLMDYMWNHDFHGRIDLSSFARLMIDMGEHEKAEDIYATLLGQLRSREDVGFVYHQLGSIKQIEGNWEDALRFYRHSLRCIPESERERGHATVATLISMAQVYSNQSDWDLSLEYTHHALAAIDACDESTKNVSVAIQESYCLHMIGTIFLEQNRLEDAFKYFERALDIKLRILPSTHPSLAISYNDLGFLYKRHERYEQALSMYETCLEIRRRSLPETHWAFAMIFNNIANTLYWLERDKEALEFSLRALDIGKRSFGENHPMVSTFQDTFEGIRAAIEESRECD